MTRRELAVPIVQTKLYRPPVVADYVARGSLDARLESGFDLPLTLLTAPAGYGKSTLVSYWLETKGTPCGWLSLDDSDSDVRVFLSYFIAAIRTIYEESCQQTLQAVGAEALPSLQVLTALLNNELEELPERTILVLDDFHSVREPKIRSILDQLLKHPLRHLHLVIISRRDPALSLSPLRVRNLVTEFRMRDLEFGDTEIFSLLQRTSAQKIDHKVVSRLQRMTEGWPAAVRLSALALQTQPDIGSLLNRFDASAGILRDYLIDEVLSAQPVIVREHLLSISILDRFSASLCEFVWGADEDNPDNTLTGPDFIRKLQELGLFCIPLDGQRSWYRLHHLFRDALYRQLGETRSPGEIKELQKRASNWFFQNDYYEDSIKYALFGSDIELAVQVVESGRHGIMNLDHWARLERWLLMFPPAAVEQYPQLMVLQCWLNLSYRYRLDKLDNDLSKLEVLLDDDSINNRTVRAISTEVSVMRSSLAYWTINSEAASKSTVSALEELPSDREYARSIALMYRAGAHQLLGEVPQAERLLIEHIKENSKQNPEFQARILQALCFIYWCEADTRNMFLAATRLLEISLSFDIAWSQSFARYFLGLKHFECNELESAVAQLEIIVDEPHRFPIQNVMHCSILQSLSYTGLGQPERAVEIANSANSLALESGNRPFVDLTAAFQADLDLRQGRIAQALNWLRTFQLSVPHVFHRYYNSEFTAIRAATAGNLDHLSTTLQELLETIESWMNRSNHRRLRIDLLGTKSLIANRESDKDSAIAHLRKAVEIGQPGQIIRPLADLGTEIVGLLNRLDPDDEGQDYIEKIIHTIQADVKGTMQNPGIVNLPDSLSPREIQVLELLSAELTNKEIAERLYLSAGTVKRHAHNIYSKLSVNGRRAAVAKGIQLGILIKK